MLFVRYYWGALDTPTNGNSTDCDTRFKEPMMIKTMPFDMSEFLETNENIALFEKEALATGNAAHIALCQSIIAKAKQRIAVSHTFSNDSPHSKQPPKKPSDS